MARGFRLRRPDGGSQLRGTDNDTLRGVDDPQLRVTQEYVEVASTEDSQIRVTQEYVEVASATSEQIRVTQEYVEVASRDGDVDPVLPDPTPDLDPILTPTYGQADAWTVLD